jgi:hypothetical protein
VTLTLSLLTPMPGVGAIITAEPHYVRAAGMVRNFTHPTNVRSMAAYYLQPGDRIRAIAVPTSRLPTARWQLQQLERVQVAAVPPPVAPGPALRSVLSTDRASYPRGEPVTLRFTVQNRGTAPVTLTFRSGQMYDFSVRRVGREVWRWSHDRMFTQAIQEVVLRAGEERVFTERWNQRDFDGNLVPPGTYTAVGWLTAEGREEATRISRDIRITQLGVRTPRTTVTEIAASPRDLMGREAVLEGSYRGMEADNGPLLRGGPPIRGAWILEDPTGSIYVVGTGRTRLSPRDTGARVRVEGIVMLAPGTRPYLRARTVERIER